MTVRSIVVSLLAASAMTFDVAVAASSKDDAALRRKCAHALKVKLGIKETGNVRDLNGIPNASQQVDQCVAARGKSQ